MGMAASQVNLNLWKHVSSDCGYKLGMLAEQKIALTKEANRLSIEYNEGLSSKKFKWSNDNGVSSTDITYSTLMSPNALNKGNTSLITDSNGRVVIDSKYKEYAEMLSENGAPSKDWESMRPEIISRLTGIDEDSIINASNYIDEYNENEAIVENLRNTKPSRNAFTVRSNNATAELLRKMGSQNNISDWASAYSSNSTMVQPGNIESVVNSLKNTLGKYFMDQQSLFEKACDETIKNDPKTTEESLKSIVDKIIGNFMAKGGATAGANYLGSDGSSQPIWYDVDSSAYQTYKTEYDQWQTQYDEAIANRDASLAAYNTLFTSEEESMIAFYDRLFSSIAEKGWTYDDQVNDPNRLNLMFQNGLYTVTEVKRISYEDEDGICYHNAYDTNLASNFSKMIQVNDSEAERIAKENYSHQKSILNKKETSIDLLIAKLTTRKQSADEMIQNTLRNIINDNIKRTLEFSA